MKISGGRGHHFSDKIPAILSSGRSPDSDLQGKKNNTTDRKPYRRKIIRNPGFSGSGVRLKKEGACLGKRSGPATPLLRWKFDDRDKEAVTTTTAAAGEDKAPHQSSTKNGRKVRCNNNNGGETSVSARKLAAELWQLQLLDVHGERRAFKQKKMSDDDDDDDQLRFEPGAGHIGVPFLCHRDRRELDAEKKDVLQSPISVCGPKNGILYKDVVLFHKLAYMLEGCWNPTDFEDLLGQQIYMLAITSFAQPINFEQCNAECGLYDHIRAAWSGFDIHEILHTFSLSSHPAQSNLKVDPSLSFPNPAMERATKWDPVCSKTSDEMYRFYGQMKLLEDQQVASVSVVSSLQTELEQARTRIDELETERRSSKKKLEHFLRKLADEKALWRSREHEKIRVVIDDVKDDLKRERKNRQRMEMLNSKLVNELAEAKLSAKRFMQDFEKERKSRELMEEVCDELAKEIGEDKAEVEALKRESVKMREEVDEERKMLQMAEVWREERVQMKLVDAKLTLEDKYSQLSKLISDLEAFIRTRSTTLDIMEMREAESLREAAGKVKIQDTKFSYEPPNSDDIFSVFEDLQAGEANGKEIQQSLGYSPVSHGPKVHTVSPDANGFSRNHAPGYSNGFIDDNGEVDDDGSGWETVSHAEEQGSSYSPNGSNPSVNRIRRDSNVSGSGKEWEEDAGRETPDTEISEISSVSMRKSKKGSSISRIWRSLPSNGENYKIISVDGTNGRLSNGRYSNGGISSPDRGSGKGGGLSPHSSMGQWSSPDSGNPQQINRGMKGCIEWPLGAQKNSLKAKLLEARMESQKIQLRHVLKQKI